MRVGEPRCRQSENNSSFTFGDKLIGLHRPMLILCGITFSLCNLKKACTLTVCTLKSRLKTKHLKPLKACLSASREKAHITHHSYNSLHTYNCLPPLLACCCYELSCDSSPSQTHRGSGVMRVCKYVGPNGLTRQIIHQFKKNKFIDGYPRWNANNLLIGYTLELFPTRLSGFDVDPVFRTLRVLY